MGAVDHVLEELDAEIEKLQSENAELKRLVRWCACEKFQVVYPDGSNAPTTTLLMELFKDCPEKDAVMKLGFDGVEEC